MSQPSDDLKSFAALKGWSVTTGSDGQLYCHGREAGLGWYLWTHPPVLGPLLTMVVEARSGLSFEIVAGPKIRPGRLDYEVQEDPQGHKNLVTVRKISPAVETWIDSLEPNAFTRMALDEHEVVSVNPEAAAITFQARGLDYAIYRARTLLDLVALLPKRKAHNLSAKLRPIAPLIRAWSVSDDGRREKRLAAASRPQLEAIVSAWREHLDLINSTIEQRPTSNLSARLMAFSEAAMEAEQHLSDDEK